MSAALYLLQGNLAPVPDPGYLSGFDNLGPVAILVGAIFGGAFVVVWLIRQFRSGNLVTDIRHREAIELKDEQIEELKSALEDEKRINATLRDDAVRQHNDLVRLADEFKNMTLNVIAAVIGKEGATEGGRGDT